MLHTSTATSGAMEGKESRTTRHRVKRNEFRLGSGAKVTIEYWVDSTNVHVAAFDANGHQASIATYHAYVDAADPFSPQVQEALVDSLANALEYALIKRPELCLRKSLVQLNA